MDAKQFDDLVAKLAKTANRRTTVRGMVGGLIAGAAAVEVSSAPAPQGPCRAQGDKCSRHRDCCTNYCNPDNKRCRCRRNGESCTADSDCCSRSSQGLMCLSGVCGFPS